MRPRLLRRAASIAIFPLLVAALGAHAIRAPSLDLAGRLGGAGRGNDALILLSALLLFYPLIALLERWLPHRREWRRAQGDLRADLLLFTGAIAGASSPRRCSAPRSPWAPGSRTSSAARSGRWAGRRSPLGLALLVAELGHYAFHRLSHESPLVWRLHAVHHSAPRLYWLNARAT
jgi:hypothetical protein